MGGPLEDEAVEDEGAAEDGVLVEAELRLAQHHSAVLALRPRPARLLPVQEAPSTKEFFQVSWKHLDSRRSASW